MFNSLFDFDKPFWKWIGRIPEMFLLSLCWYVCCLPIVTIIPASCALFSAVSRNLLRDEKGCYSRFFRTFWKELKQGIPLTLIWLAVGLLAYYGDCILSAAGDASGAAMFSVVYRIMILMMLGFLSWLVPLQSRYNNTIASLHINSFRFFLGRLPTTGLLLLYTALVLLVCFFNSFTLILLLIAPCLIAVLHTRPVEKSFARVFPQDYEDGIAVYSEEEREAIRAIARANADECAED